MSATHSSESPACDLAVTTTGTLSVGLSNINDIHGNQNGSCAPSVIFTSDSDTADEVSRLLIFSMFQNLANI